MRHLLELPYLTNGQYYAVCVGLVLMAVTGALMARSQWRRHRSRIRSLRAHPANRQPYDWAADSRLRQPSHVRRIA